MSESAKQARCCGLMGAIFGYKFRPRYSTKEDGSPPPDEIALAAIKEAEATNNFVSSALEALGGAYRMTQRTYHCDVCERCGLTINLEA